VSPEAWGGIVALINSATSGGGFGRRFPVLCRDGHVVCGTDTEALALAARSELPGIEWPPSTLTLARNGFISTSVPHAPDTFLVLDLLEFCHRLVEKPEEIEYHEYYKHQHLRFDRDRGQQEFREGVNRILARNGIAFELGEDGKVVRLGPLALREDLARTVFNTGDSKLDELLEESRRKFLSPDPTARRESVERLWDAFERTKTLGGGDKKLSVQALIDSASSEPAFRQVLESEARELTRVGNEFHIRHYETNRIPIDDMAHVDYLFHRLFAFLLLVLGKTGRIRCGGIPSLGS